MRCLVRSGIDRAAGELFSVAETVPAARPRCFATVFSVTFLFSLRGPAFFFCVGVISRPRQTQAFCQTQCGTYSTAPCSGRSYIACREYSRPSPTSRQRPPPQLPLASMAPTRFLLLLKRKVGPKI